MVMNKQQDAFGQQLYDYLNFGTEHAGITERSDGQIDTSGANSIYFSSFRNWFGMEKKAIRYVRGRVLDIGSGAGRHSLYLQEKGFDVTGLDNSPLALEVCRQRGLKKTVLMPFNRINSSIGEFDTVIMMGNNFGLFGNYKRAKRLLRKLHAMTSKKGRIIAASADVYRTDNPVHLAYQENNRTHGRMSGQIKIRCRYQKLISPWFDYLIVSKPEMENILDGTGWKVSRYIDSDTAYYMAVIDKIKAGDGK